MTSVSSQKRIGGLVLDQQELTRLLNKPRTIGLAFALSKPGHAPNVHLKVYRVYEEDGSLQGIEEKIPLPHAAQGPHSYPSGKPDQFEFRYKDQLTKDQFAFGYFNKEGFNRLFKHGFGELYLGGAKKDYGFETPGRSENNPEEGKTEWFTLAVSVRRKLRQLPSNGTSNRGSGSHSGPFSRAMERRDISLAQFTGQSRVSLSSLRRISPELFDLSPTVEDFILNKDGSAITGLILKTDSGPVQVEFQTDTSIDSIQLDLDGCIKRINFLIPGFLETIDSESESDDKEAIELGNPFIGHFEPCPPWWYPGSASTLESNFKDVIRNLIGI